MLCWEKIVLPQDQEIGLELCEHLKYQLGYRFLREVHLAHIQFEIDELY
jgi:hypothetical protein